MPDTVQTEDSGPWCTEMISDTIIFMAIEVRHPYRCLFLFPSRQVDNTGVECEHWHAICPISYTLIRRLLT